MYVIFKNEEVDITTPNLPKFRLQQHGHNCYRPGHISTLKLQWNKQVFFGSKLNNLMLLVHYGVFCTFFILDVIENSHEIQKTMLQSSKNHRSPISANKLNSNFLKMTRANVFQTLCTHMIWSKILIPIFFTKIRLTDISNQNIIF